MGEGRRVVPVGRRLSRLALPDTVADNNLEGNDGITAACGAAVAVLLAWRGRSLLTVAVAACCAVALAQGALLLM